MRAYTASLDVAALGEDVPLLEGIRTTCAIRRFRPDPVPRETVERILALASRAPSGTNIQPWQVIVVAGEARARLTRAMHTEFMQHGEQAWQREFAYYPDKQWLRSSRFLNGCS